MNFPGFTHSINEGIVHRRGERRQVAWAEPAPVPADPGHILAEGGNQSLSFAAMQRKALLRLEIL